MLPRYSQHVARYKQHVSRQHGNMLPWCKRGLRMTYYRNFKFSVYSVCVFVCLYFSAFMFFTIAAHGEIKYI